MKRSIIKKTIACVLSIIMTGIFAIPSFAAENSSAVITPTTVITEDNIIDVMNYLGLDTDKLIIEPQENGLTSVTVGELQAQIENAQEAEPVISTDTYSVEMPPTRASSIKTKMVYTTVETSSYTVTVSVSIQYEQFNAGIRIWEKFLSIGSMDATVANNGVILNSYAITSKDFSGQILDNGNSARVDYELTVTTYIDIKFARIPLKDTIITGMHVWHAETIN